jgi:hypothetical protein
MPTKTERVEEFLRSERFSLMLGGATVGIASNIVGTSAIFFTNPVWDSALFVSFIASLLLVWLLYRAARMKRTRKVRLIFLGISLSSLLFALLDFLRYIFGYKSIKISWGPPYLWFGDIPFISLLGSIFLGSLFGVLERVLDVWEKP